MIQPISAKAVYRVVKELSREELECYAAYMVAHLEFMLLSQSTDWEKVEELHFEMGHMDGRLAYPQEFENVMEVVRKVKKRAYQEMGIPREDEGKTPRQVMEERMVAILHLCELNCPDLTESIQQLFEKGEGEYAEVHVDSLSQDISMTEDDCGWIGMMVRYCGFFGVPVMFTGYNGQLADERFRVLYGDLVAHPDAREQDSSRHSN